jgi:hypothetical protein
MGVVAICEPGWGQVVPETGWRGPATGRAVDADGRVSGAEVIRPVSRRCRGAYRRSTLLGEPTLIAGLLSVGSDNQVTQSAAVELTTLDRVGGDLGETCSSVAWPEVGVPRW